MSIEMSVGYNDDDVIYEAVDPSKGHDSYMVDNVIYSGLNRKERKRQKSNLDKFHAWSKNLGSQFNQDGVRSETHTFQYSQKTTEYDRKGRPITTTTTRKPQQQSDSNVNDATAEEMKNKYHNLPYYSNDPQVQRFILAKKAAGLI